MSTTSANETGRATSLVRIFVLSMLAAVIVGGLRLPWSLGAIVFGVLALVLGIQAIVAARREKRGTAVGVMVGIGLILTGITVVTQLAKVVLWPVQWELEQCLDSAITTSAEQACRDDLRDRLTPAGLFGVRS